MLGFRKVSTRPSGVTASSCSMRRFELRFTPVYRAAAAAFGVSPGTAWADITDDSLIARFGPWTLRTPLINITSVKVTGPYAVVKTAGPARLSVSDRGLTFATNSNRGVLVTFAQPVPGIAPFGWLPHPELTITVAEIDAFVALLQTKREAALRHDVASDACDGG